MTEFISIKEAKSQGKGNIRFIVVSIGELKSGTTKTGDEWQKQTAVIKDESSAMNLTLWNNDIGEIIDGKTYTLENAYWTDYKGEPQLSLGKFYKLNEISQLPTNSSTIESKVVKHTSQEEFHTSTVNEMIAQTFEMVQEMYSDFMNRKAKK